MTTLIGWHTSDLPEFPACVQAVPVYPLDYASQNAPFDPAKITLEFRIGGKKVTDAAARRRLATLPILDWPDRWFNWGDLHGDRPVYPAFSLPSVQAVERCVKDAKRRLRGWLREAVVSHSFDFEQIGPFIPSKFSTPLPPQTSPDGKQRWAISQDESWPVNVPHLATCCGIITTALAKAKWATRGLANYACQHGHERIEYGGGAYARMTPIHLPGLDHTTSLFNVYGSTDDELADVLARAPMHSWIAIRHDDPQRDERIKKIRGTGRFDFVFVYGGWSV